jgi:GNAT superfamily N-acetyltransferase
MQIRKAEPKDVSSLIVLMRDFAEFEKLAKFFEATEESLYSAMFGETAFVEGLVAFDEAKPIAYAIFYPSFSSFRGQCGYFLEDIFIDANYRGLRLGERMLREIAKLARSRGFTRIEFQVLDWNTPAIEFYKKLGAVRDEETSDFKFVDEAFHSLADK